MTFLIETNDISSGKVWTKKISKYLRLTKEDKAKTRWKQWQVEIREGGGKNFQLSVEEMSVQAGGNNWKGRVPSVLYRFKHVRSPDWPGNHRLHIAIFFLDKKIFCCNFRYQRRFLRHYKFIFLIAEKFEFFPTV